MDRIDAEYLGYEKEAEAFLKLSGKKESGESSSSAVYQFYNEYDKDGANALHLLSSAVTNVWSDPAHEGIVTVEFEFRSYDDPVLLLLVRHLSAFDEGVTKNPEKRWIFYINITRVDELADDKAFVLTLHAANPVLWCVSGKTPSQVSEAESSGASVRGSIVKMLFTADSLEIEESDERDMSQVKAEMLRELDDETFS